jgi:hypothetical protein
MYSAPSTLVILLPRARAMNRGTLSTEAHERTGLLTPPGLYCRASAKSAADLLSMFFSLFYNRFAPCLASAGMNPASRRRHKPPPEHFNIFNVKMLRRCLFKNRPWIFF